MNAMKHARLNVVHTGPVNKCSHCGTLPIYRKSPCNHGFTLMCPNCNNHSGICTDNLLRPEADKLRRAWNDITVDGVFTNQASYRGYKGKIETGSLVLVKSLDSYIEDITDDIDVLLARLKNESEKGIDIDYDICQFVPTEGGFVLHHVTTSRVCIYLMCGKMPDDIIK